jgi:regulatory protein
MSSSETTALQRAVGFLSRREHSQQELRYKLSEREYTEDEIEAALQRLIENGLQSDERFVESYVESRYQRGHGPYKISAELKQRGVEESLIDQGLYSNQIDWYEQVVQVYQKKYANKPAGDYKEQAKRSRFLQQRGFSSEQIQHAMNMTE